MDVIIKGMFTSLCALIIAYLITGSIAASVGNREASAYINNAVEAIEASNCADSVVTAVKESAKDNGYTLNVMINKQGGNNDCKYGYAELTYHYAIPIVGLSKDHTITQYIR